ncbi:MAG: amino acid--tRNA ligase-related protein [Candidatus Paceibacterota bacterium]
MNNHVSTSFWDISAPISKLHEELDGVQASIAGRVVGYRRMGGVAFGQIVDQSGKIQFCFNKRDIALEYFKTWSEDIHLGDIIGIAGVMWTSSTGERTLNVTQSFKLLQRPVLSWPDKHTGIVDPEVRLRKRYLDCIVHPEVKEVFKIRHKVIQCLRDFLTYRDFTEIETPILTPQASGAQARPFITHHHALDSDFYLRIAPETYLKRAVAGGFDRVFEIGKQFRNEGIDPSHMQEFTTVEWYSAYSNYLDNLALFHDYIARLQMVVGNRGFLQNLNIEPVKVLYRDLFHTKVGTYPDSHSATEADRLFKTLVRPTIIAPTYVLDYPAHMSPMAARKPDDNTTAEQWQFIVNGWEVVKCYTELTDPVLQRKLLEEQMAQRASGDAEAMMLEEDFLECMEHGMPPMSGLGLGIDRLVCLITEQTTLRDVVLFPTLRTSK